MWNKVADFILRNKRTILIVIGIITVFMGYNMKNLRMKYTSALLLNEKDSAYVRFLDFKKTFGEDGSMMVVAFEDKDFVRLDKFNDLLTLQDSLKNVIGIKSVLSYANAITLAKDTAEKKFVINKIFDPKPNTQAELDSMFKAVKDFLFYERLLYTDNNCYVMALTCDPEVINHKERDIMIADMEKLVYGFTGKYDIKSHIFGSAAHQKQDDVYGKGRADYICDIVANYRCDNLLGVFPQRKDHGVCRLDSDGGRRLDYGDNGSLWLRNDNDERNVAAVDDSNWHPKYHLPPQQVPRDVPRIS